MKVVTANRLDDGAVVYLTENRQWSPNLVNAAQFDDDLAPAVLEAAAARAGEITEAYLISVADDGAPAGREALRESIRAAGPTIRADLGKQAEAR